LALQRSSDNAASPIAIARLKDDDVVTVDQAND